MTVKGPIICTLYLATRLLTIRHWFFAVMDRSYLTLIIPSVGTVFVPGSTYAVNTGMCRSGP